jgi:hypothetical protein
MNREARIGEATVKGITYRFMAEKVFLYAYACFFTAR